MSLDALYAYTAVDPDGVEAICGILNPESGRWTPMLAMTRELADEWKPIAIHLAETSGAVVSLVRWESRTVVDEFEP